MMTHLQMDQDKSAQGQNSGSSGNSGLQNGVSNQLPAANPPIISPAASPTNVSTSKIVHFKLKLVNFHQKYQFSIELFLMEKLGSIY